MTRDEYEQYRQGSWWRTFSRLTVQSHKYCAHCGFRHELNVHHRTYERLGREEFSDVIVLCKSCHSREHFLDNLDLMPAFLFNGSRDDTRQRLERQQKDAKKKNVEREDEVRNNIKKQKEEDY